MNEREAADAGASYPRPEGAVSHQDAGRMPAGLTSRTQGTDPLARPMSLFFDIGTGVGLSSATGVRPYLPPLLAGALARGDAGVDFENTSYDFLEEPWFLVAVLGIAVVAYFVDRTRGTRPDESADPVAAGLGVLGLVIGGLLFAGSLADGGHTPWPGLLAGAAAAALGYLAVAQLFARARTRLRSTATSTETGAPNLLDAYADAIALVLAGLSILAPPVGYVAIVAFLVLLVRARGSGDKKYEGLRVLR